MARLSRYGFRGAAQAVCALSQLSLDLPRLLGDPLATLRIALRRAYGRLLGFEQALELAARRSIGFKRRRRHAGAELAALIPIARSQLQVGLQQTRSVLAQRFQVPVVVLAISAFKLPLPTNSSQAFIRTSALSGVVFFA